MNILRSPASILVLAAVVAACESGGGTDPSVATELAAASVLDQTGVAGTAVAEGPAVRVTDQRGDGMPGVSVTFAVAAGGGSVSPATVATGDDGVARTAWTMGTQAGGNTVVATVAALSGRQVEFRATSGPGAASQVAVVSGGGQTAPAFSAPAAPLVVRVADAHGNPVPGITVAFAVTAGEGTVTPATAVSNAAGQAQTAWTFGTSGTNTVRATGAGLAQPAEFSGEASGIATVRGTVRDAVTFQVLPGATVRISNEAGSGAAGMEAAGAYTAQAVSDAQGEYRFQSVPGGVFQVEVEKAGHRVATAPLVSVADRAGGETVLVDFAPSPAGNTQPFASLSGRVAAAAGGPAGNALVTLSGGAQTNGTFKSTRTAADGTFSLAGISLVDFQGDPITSFQVRASLPGFAATRTVQLVRDQTLANTDLVLAPGASVTVVFTDGFESASAWTATGIWNRSTLAGIRNTAHPTYVDAAPNDTSQGRLPAPSQGNWAYWYGRPASGNFLETQVAGDSPRSGGTSTTSNDGLLVSPAFTVPADLAQATLWFDSWFEIESVNPNLEGFDILSVSIHDVAANQTVELGRLNPFEDPPFDDRDATPFTAGGFNRAPVWTSYGVDISAFRGRSIRVVYSFDTVDELYNGFRGWIVDQVRVDDAVLDGPAASASRRALSRTGVQHDGAAAPRTRPRRQR